MNFVVIGTDHRMQHSEAGFGGLLRALSDLLYFEPLEAVAEEHSEIIGLSIGQRVAQERSLRWYNLDMSAEEKARAGILEEQRSRPEPQGNVVWRLPSDELRETAWVEKLGVYGAGTTIVICGYLHFESLTRKLREKGHTVDTRVYLQAVPVLKLFTNWAG